MLPTLYNFLGPQCTLGKHLIPLEEVFKEHLPVGHLPWGWNRMLPSILLQGWETSRHCESDLKMHKCAFRWQKRGWDREASLQWRAQTERDREVGSLMAICDFPNAGVSLSYLGLAYLSQCVSPFLLEPVQVGFLSRGSTTQPNGFHFPFYLVTCNLYTCYCIACAPWHFVSHSAFSLLTIFHI